MSKRKVISILMDNFLMTKIIQIIISTLDIFLMLVSTHLNANYLNFKMLNFKKSKVFWTATSVQISQMAFCAFFWVLYNYVWHCSSLRVGVNVLKHYLSTWIQTCSTLFAGKAIIVSSVYVALGLRLIFLTLSPASCWNIS